MRSSIKSQRQLFISNSFAAFTDTIGEKIDQKKKNTAQADLVSDNVRANGSIYKRMKDYKLTF